MPGFCVHPETQILVAMLGVVLILTAVQQASGAGWHHGHDAAFLPAFPANCNVGSHVFCPQRFMPSQFSVSTAVLGGRGRDSGWERDSFRDRDSGRDREGGWGRGRDRDSDRDRRPRFDDRNSRNDDRGAPNEARSPRNDRKGEYTRGDGGEQPIENEAEIKSLLERREVARRNRDFNEADDIRDQLLVEMGVHVDDQKRVWWPEGTRPSNADFGSEDVGSSNQRGGPRVPGPAWSRDEPFNIDVDEKAVLVLLEKRDVARRARDFDLADDLMDELRSLGVAYADDKSRVWTASDPNAKGSMRPTDWDCPECGALVYGSKTACYKCNCPRPLDRQGPGKYRDPRDKGEEPRGFRDSREGRDDRGWDQRDERGPGRDERGSGRDRDERGWGGRDDRSRGRDDRGWGGRDDRRGDRDREGGGGRRLTLGRGGNQDVYSDRFPPFQRSGDMDTEVDAERIESLLAEREKARRFKDFTAADDIREELRRDHGVAIDDQAREWKIDRGGRGGGGGGGGRRSDDRRGGGRQRESKDWEAKDLGWDD